MSGFEVVGLVVAILLSVALVLALVLVPVGIRARRMKRELEADVGPGVRLAQAQGFGLQSKGKAQVRGTGWLSLTDDELVFRMWWPRRETRIPRSAITAVETPRGWLGKSVGARLLCVRWASATGEDAMAWHVRDLDEWVAALS